MSSTLATQLTKRITAVSLAVVAALVAASYALGAELLDTVSGEISQRAREEIAAIFFKDFLLVAAIGGMGAALIITLDYFFLRRLCGALTAIAEGAERCAQGDFSRPVPAASIAGVGRLVEAMNDMAVQLDERARTVREQHHERASILFSIGEGVVAVDKDHCLLLLNQAASEMFGVDQFAARGNKLDDMPGARQLGRMVREILATGLPQRKELRLMLGRSRSVEVKGSVLKDADYRTLGVVLVLNDVTQLRQLESVRRDFVANVSHELKTPITSIQGFVETLLDGALEDPSVRKHFLEIVLHQAKRLRKIIEDLLVLARVENSEEECHIDTAPIAVGELIDGALLLCRERANEKQISLRTECSDREMLIHVNRLLLEQALVNLLNNSIIYSNTGGSVTVKASVQEGIAVLSVSDSGIGIAKQHLPRLFERFYRIDKGRSRQEGGSGLGLAIVKHIAVVHGGNVSVESTVGEGSTFSINLPQQQEAAADNVRQPAELSQGVTLLSSLEPSGQRTRMKASPNAQEKPLKSAANSA